MSSLGTVYATKRRRRNGKSIKPSSKEGIAKSNPSKRHRERLNAELDTLASLLPFDQNILSKLDKLSILRLSVSYLRTKSYFQVAINQGKEERFQLHGEPLYRSRELGYSDIHGSALEELFLQSLNGFLLILTCDGEVFFSTQTIENYLGFHQSDIVHQSVFELVHSEDREELQRQLLWNCSLPQESMNMSFQEIMHQENSSLLDRSFTVRFRCLLDNTSGFLRLDIHGRIKFLHGQNKKSNEIPLALFAICTPFGPPSLLEFPQKDVMFKSKHKLDFNIVSMDQRGKIILGYCENDLMKKTLYSLVHYDDLAYVASAHQELLKTGASGMIAYRLQAKNSSWQWLQTSSRLIYKNSKPDFIISTHRPLIEEEGKDLLGKRTMDFKVSYLDINLNNNYLIDSEPVNNHSQPKMNRRHKNQLRDYLTSCRNKKKTATEYNSENINNYRNYAGVYANSSLSYTNEAPIYSIPSTFQNFQNLYQTIDNRLIATDNLISYRHLNGYYPEYTYHVPMNSASYTSNGFLETPSRSCTNLGPYDPNQFSKCLPSSTDSKIIYPCNLDADKYDSCNIKQSKPQVSNAYTNFSLSILSPPEVSTNEKENQKREHTPMVYSPFQPTASSSSINSTVSNVKTKLVQSDLKNKKLKDEIISPYPTSGEIRQTVLSWAASAGNSSPILSLNSVPSMSSLNTIPISYTDNQIKKTPDVIVEVPSLSTISTSIHTCNKWDISAISSESKPARASHHNNSSIFSFSTAHSTTGRKFICPDEYRESSEVSLYPPAEVWDPTIYHHTYSAPLQFNPHNTGYSLTNMNAILCCPSRR